MTQPLTLAELDKMFDDSGDSYFDPRATITCDTVEAARMLTWANEPDNAEYAIQSSGEVWGPPLAECLTETPDEHDELLRHLHLDDGCPHVD